MSVKKYKSLSDLQVDMYAIMRSVIVNDLEPYVKQLIQDAVYENVYSTYFPPSYQRRYDKGGLGDMSLMVSSTIVDSLESGQLQRFIEHVVNGADNDQFTSPGAFSEAIQTRSWFAGDPENFMPARPYMYRVEDRIRENPDEFLRLIKKGFAQRGVRVR